MKIYKVGVIGPFASGKTLFVKTVAGPKAYFTEKPVSEEHRRQVKATTTVGIDFTYLDWFGGNKVHIYGTPGQEHLSTIVELIDPMVEGYVLVLTPDHAEAVDEHIKRWAANLGKPLVDILLSSGIFISSPSQLSFLL